MVENNIQQQVDELNRKVDLMLEIMSRQSQRSDAMQDLIEDLSIVGKDAFQTAVDELTIQNIQVDGEDVKYLIFKFLRNIKTFGELMDTLESVMDFLNDAGPIVKDAGIAVTNSLGEFEKQGYFEFLKEVRKILDNIVKNYPPEEVRALADNIVTILDTVKNLTQPDMLSAINNAVNIFKNLDTTEVKEYSLWKAFREMNTPEMKRGIGFMITFMKNLSKESNVSK